MIELCHVSKTFGTHTVLKDISFLFPDAGLFVLEGENGSGKTTLLNLLSLMDNHYQGNFLINGVNTRNLSDKERAAFRADKISYVFQKDNLISYLSLKENEELPEILRRNNTSADGSATSNELSQGQQELAVLKRGLAPGKGIYLLDEITSCLDDENFAQIYPKILDLSKSALVLVVSHDSRLNVQADSHLLLKQGQLTSSATMAEPCSPHAPVASESHVHVSSLLVRKSFCSSSFSYLLAGLLSLIYCLLGWVGLIGIEVNTYPYLEQAMAHQEVIQTTTDNSLWDEPLLSSFPENASRKIATPLEYSLVISTRHDDGKAYANSHVYQSITRKNEKPEISFRVAKGEVTLPLVEDDSLPADYLYTDSSYSQFLTKKATQIFVNQGFWETDKYHARHAMQGLITGPTFATKDYLESILNTTLDTVPEPDTLYVTDPNLVASQLTTFQVPLPREANDDLFINLNEAFPQGVRVQLVSPGKGNAFSSEWKEYVLVSNETLDKIVNLFPDYSNLLISLSSSRKAILSYLSQHAISVGFYSGSSTSQERTSLESYEAFCASKNSPNARIWCSLLIYSMPVFLFFLMGVFGTALANKEKTNDRVLFSAGMTEKQLCKLHNLPVLLSLFFSVGAGFLIAYLKTRVSLGNAFPFFSWFDLGWIVLTWLVSDLVFLLSYGIRRKKQ